MASNEANCAAISAEVCAELYNLVIIDRDIQDQNVNTTRFFVIGLESDEPTGEDKTLVMITLDQRQPGGLCDALSVFKKENINITKVDSRPIPGKRWEYYFFIEFEGHFKNPNPASALTELQKYCVDVKVMGSYPK